MTKLEDLKSCIKQKCIENTFNLPLWFEDTQVSINEAYKNNTSKEYFDRLKEAVKNFNGKVLCENYINGEHKMNFLCYTHNEIFESKPRYIFSGSWNCKHCKKDKHLKSLNVYLLKKKEDDKNKK